MAKNKAKTKSEIYNELIEASQLTRKQVASVFDGLTTIVEQELGKKGPGMFTIPGLLKLKVISKPATKAREGINPFTKEKTIFKAKPARNVVKVRPMRGLKKMV